MGWKHINRCPFNGTHQNRVGQMRQETSHKTVIVTGAAGGMGSKVCRYLSSCGWQVLALDHNRDRLAQLQQERGVRTLGIELQATDLVQQVIQQLQDMPDVWGLVNMAGASIGDSLDTMSLDDWQQSFDINVTPAFRLIQAVAPLMRQQGGGSVINVGSPVGIVGARKPSYAASKAALTGLTMSCARALGKDQIRVNLLLPGPTITEMTKDWNQERRDAIAQATFLRRLCEPQEVAEVIGFLLSPASRYMTGSIVDMTAGSMYGH